jgi:hypothetical protein
MAYRHDGFFYAMDTYREYQHLNDLWSRGIAPWKNWDDAPLLPAPTPLNGQPYGTGGVPPRVRPMGPRGE